MSASVSSPELQWQQLQRVALLGTRQSGEAAPALPELPPVPAGDADAREKQLLLAAGALSLMRKAGWQPVAALPAATASPAPETLRPLGANGQQHLRQLLGGYFPGLLPGYLADLARHGRRVPPPELVDLLNAVAARPELYAATAAVLGQRGQWLATQNPGWAPLLSAAPEADEAHWETGSLRQRSLFLLSLRRRDPARARTLLAATLPQEPAKTQAALLATLADSLTADDEPLLQAYLAAKSKEVRQTVLPLLMRLPQAPGAERLWQRASALVQLESKLLGKKLLVTLPEAWDKTWLADGIEEKDGRFAGQKAAWLGQLLALIPPARWVAHWKLKPAKILDLAAGSDWADTLLMAWREALVLHQDADWAQAYLERQLNDPKMPALPGEAATQLLSPAGLTALLLAQLPAQPRFTQPEAPWESLLLALPGPWPLKLTQQALRIIENTLIQTIGTASYLVHHRLQELLRHMQLAVPPTQREACATSLQALMHQDYNITRRISELLDALQFRQQLALSLTEPPDAALNEQ
jgi:hypothetical protein